MLALFLIGFFIGLALALPLVWWQRRRIAEYQRWMD